MIKTNHFRENRKITISPNIKSIFLKSFRCNLLNISTPHRKIELALANRIFLKQIKEMLLDFDIKTSKTYSMITSKGFKKYAFYVRTNSNLSIFSKMIGFNHFRENRKITISP